MLGTIGEGKIANLILVDGNPPLLLIIQQPHLPCSH
jgi:hypothetical protein